MMTYHHTTKMNQDNGFWETTIRYLGLQLAAVFTVPESTTPP
jgi:hypothetical protein